VNRQTTQWPAAGLTIGGLAELAGVGVETVRYYERRGLMHPTGQTGRRRYTEDSIRRLALIRRAKRLGFTLAEIGELLDSAASGSHESIQHGSPSADRVLDAARAKLADVEESLRELTAQRCRLARLVRACAAGDRSCVALAVGDEDGTR
jgi:DNA-binding transcriptional MerR regulator